MAVVPAAPIVRTDAPAGAGWRGWVARRREHGEHDRAGDHHGGDAAEVADAEAQIRPIFDQWRSRGLIGSGGS